MKSFIFALASLGLLAAGCGKKEPEETSINFPGGLKIDASDKGGLSIEDGKGTSFKANENGMQMQTKEGDSFSTNVTVTEADLGLPFYPGSTEQPGSIVATENGVKSVISSRATADEPAQVVDFYKGKLSMPNPSDMTTADAKIAFVSGKLESGAEVTISASRKVGANATEISIGVKFPKG